MMTNHSEEPTAASVPVAIVGLACELPGVTSVSAMADVLFAGRRAYARFAGERIPPALYLDASAPVGAAKIYTDLGGVTPHGAPPDDAGAPPEVHRRLLAATARALASAGLAAHALRGQPVPIAIAHSRGGGHGLYDAAVLAASEHLLPALIHAAHPDELSPRELAAVVDHVRGQLRASFAPHFIAEPRQRAVHRLAGVIGEALGTTEQAVIVDGNCTGGLIALERAQHALARGAPWAIAGALSYVDTVNQVLYSNARLLSKTGCDPFAETGDGTVISDGVVVLVLATLERARRDGLPIHGVIRGVAGGNDGAVERYMLTPHARGHGLAIARAQDRAGVAATAPGAFFAHGSGTPAGDTVEAAVFDRALRRGADRPARPVPVLSVKGHVGHAKEAAGLANLIGALAVFERERVPAPVHDQPARAAAPAVELRDTARAWPAGGSPRIAGVSAIASGGQAYHAVIEDASAVVSQREVVRRGWRDSPIAIVGLAGEFAGAPSLGAWWRRLLAGEQAFVRGAWPGWAAPLELPIRRFTERAAAYGERPADIARHDPLHFLLVDLARRAAARSELRAGDNVSVVVSAEHASEYGLRQVAVARMPEIEASLARALRATGKHDKEAARTVRGAIKRLAQDLPELWPGSLFNVAPSFLAARIARAFDVTGPVCAVEAGGAASSIAGLEIACHRLADREVDAAVWATADRRLGALRASDEAAYVTSAATPAALDRTSAGYALGEAATAVVLRRLDDAERRGDPIYGVIRAIGSGFAPLAPGALADADALGRAIERAYAACEVASDDLAFVECFATGHPASDAAELAALTATLGAARATALPLGAVMPNIGHTGAAAGAASLLKAVLALATGCVPATAGARAPHTADRLRVITRNTPLVAARFAGVTAAGAGGTCFHVVVERGRDTPELA